MDQQGRKIGLFGVPFDPLPSSEGLAIKHRYMQALSLGNVEPRNTLDPYDFFLELLPAAFSEKSRCLGKVSIPSWLQPRPQPSDAEKLDMDALNEFIKSGGKLISKASLDEYGTKPLDNALKALKARRVYISLDIDIGSLSSVYACRFLDTVGLSFEGIQDIFQSVLDFIPGHFTLAGFDLMEVDIYKMGARLDNTHVDQAGKVGASFFELIAKLV